MGIETKIAALASAFLLGISPGVANAQEPVTLLKTTPLAKRGFAPYHAEHSTRRVLIPKTKKIEVFYESIFYYSINGSILIEYVRNGKVVDAFICRQSVLNYYANNDSGQFEDLSPEPNPACNQKDFAKP